MTEIQAQSLPALLAGKDVIGQAKTGSGKTAAFGLALLNKLDISDFRVQAMILCPTRELADQVAKAVRNLARSLNNVKILALCGGSSFRTQLSSLQHGAHIIVGTPGRILKHLDEQNLDLSSLNFWALDEGDRMLDMGFQDQLEAIHESMPKNRQTVLFSATYPKQIATIAEEFTTNATMITVDNKEDRVNIEQRFYLVAEGQRLAALKLVLLEQAQTSTIVFCTTKIETQSICNELRRSGFDALALHGDLEQIDRDETLIRFSQRSASILCATDVASRGLDIEDVDTVINYQIPKKFESYLHRIGRSGRAGKNGSALSFFGSKEDRKLKDLAVYLGHALDIANLPHEDVLKKDKVSASMTCLKINSGKKHKLRAGNILGALTGEGGLKGDQVGKIHINDSSSYVSVSRNYLKVALQKLKEEKYKGRSLQGWPFK
jgi:ATP-independent RNA helicase DbpA